MRIQNRDNPVASDVFIEPGDEGKIISFPDQPGGDLQVVNVGDAAKESAWAGMPQGGGSTLTAPVTTTLRAANLDQVPAGTTFSDDDMKQRLANRRWLHTLQPDGTNLAQDVPEDGWADPRL